MVRPGVGGDPDYPLLGFRTECWGRTSPSEDRTKFWVLVFQSFLHLKFWYYPHRFGGAAQGRGKGRKGRNLPRPLLFA